MQSACQGQPLYLALCASLEFCSVSAIVDISEDRGETRSLLTVSAEAALNWAKRRGAKAPTNQVAKHFAP
jgi:hypothetical protein